MKNSTEFFFFRIQILFLVFLFLIARTECQTRNNKCSLRKEKKKKKKTRTFPKNFHNSFPQLANKSKKQHLSLRVTVRKFVYSTVLKYRERFNGSMARPTRIRTIRTIRPSNDINPSFEGTMHRVTCLA